MVRITPSDESVESSIDRFYSNTEIPPELINEVCRPDFLVEKYRLSNNSQKKG